MFPGFFGRPRVNEHPNPKSGSAPARAHSAPGAFDSYRTGRPRTRTVIGVSYTPAMVRRTTHREDRHMRRIPLLATLATLALLTLSATTAIAGTRTSRYYDHKVIEYDSSTSSVGNVEEALLLRS